MKFLTDIDKDKYDEFVSNHNKKSHFLQSYCWGQFSKKSRGLIPHYLGLEDNKGNLVAATLLLQKKLPLGYSYFYSPRGFVIDFTDEKLLTEFVDNIKLYTKKYKSIFIKIDPDIIIKKTSNDDNELEVNNDYKKQIDNIKECGFVHKGYTNNFETNQPRFTFRIDLTQDKDTLFNNFSKSNKQRIKKAEQYHIETFIGKEKDIEDFYNLLYFTESRKDFVTHDKDYYVNLYKTFYKDKATIHLGKINIDKNIADLNNKIDSIDKELDTLSGDDLSKNQVARKNKIGLEKEKFNLRIKEFCKIKEKYGNEIILSACYIIEFGDKCWTLYAGNHNILSEANTTYKVYSDLFMHYHDKGIKIADQFGTTGDLRKENPLYGIYEFKKKFGGDFIEFIGEFDLITNKLMYFIFTKLVPIYRKLIRNITRRKIKKETK